MVWKGEVVCADCHAAVSVAKPLPATATAQTPARQPTSEIPEYSIAHSAGTMLIVIGILQSLAGIFLVLIALGDHYGNMGISIYYGAALGVGGIVVAAFGQLTHCVRDMARNSFKV